MFDITKYYKKENEKAKNDYQKSLEEIRKIKKQTANCADDSPKKKYCELFNAISARILKFAEYEKKFSPEYFDSKDFAELKKENYEMFKELIDKNYDKSYANPTYCVKIFGDRFGQLFCKFYVNYRRYISFSFTHKIYKMAEHNQLFCDVFYYVYNNKPDYEKLKEKITKLSRHPKLFDLEINIKESLDKDYNYYLDIIKRADFADLRYLFRYGKYISENEIEFAEFLQNYSEDKIKKIANQVVEAYITGFENNRKDISKKSTVRVIFKAGQERIIRELCKILQQRKLTPLINTIPTKDPNKQYKYDHRFDNALYFDKDYSQKVLNIYKNAYEKTKLMSQELSGVIFFDLFGEKPFKPKNKKESLKLSPQQQKLMQSHRSIQRQIHNKYIPRGETSFSMISFPSPEIGKNFAEIYDDILKVNMLKTEVYEPIQQKIIDALDKADFVHVKGKGDSQTDIKVKMQKINNPEKETNFVNCGADVNIPLGEVFTSPQLKGTNGILHVKETYLNGLRYIDLKLTFKDGYITDYICKNFEKKEDNKKYIKENLLFPHDTLPVGEFAIGTNTLAYVIAQKYKILDVLPILIIEKMGPHFAVGDTCFSFEEDKPVFNPDNKEITARENEKTKLRKEDMSKAYTHCHTDITLPYESLKNITAVTKEGKKIDIIRDERFVLPGTEELNKPFK